MFQLTCLCERHIRLWRISVVDFWYLFFYRHAYYVCISQLLCLHPMMQVTHLYLICSSYTDPGSQPASSSSSSSEQEADGNVAGAGGSSVSSALGASYFEQVGSSIYVCGDSHSLCPAWRVIHTMKTNQAGGSGEVQQKQSCLLRSALVTGLKHWHLRPGEGYVMNVNSSSSNSNSSNILKNPPIISIHL